MTVSILSGPTALYSKKFSTLVFRASSKDMFKEITLGAKQCC